MKKSIVIVLMLLGGVAFSQGKKNDKQPAKPETKTETPASTQAASPETAQANNPAQQTSPFINHFLMKFNVAMRFNDSDVAKDALYDLLVENPGNDSLFLDLAYMYYENQKYPSTILVSQELMARNAKNTTAVELAASSFEALGIKDKALQHYETLYLQTNAYAALYKMAFLQYELKRFKECDATCDILLSKKEGDDIKVTYPTAENKDKEYPIKVSVLNLKGMVAKDNGDKVNAKKFFDQALAISPDFQQAKENLTSLK